MRLVHHFTPPTKRQSMVWKGSDKPSPVKFKVTSSGNKVLRTVFWDSRCTIYKEYLECGETVTADWYFDTLLKLRKAIKAKRSGLLTCGIIFLHNNTGLHKAELVKGLLCDLKCFHPPGVFMGLSTSGFSFVLFVKAKFWRAMVYLNLKHRSTNMVPLVLENFGQKFTLLWHK